MKVTIQTTDGPQEIEAEEVHSGLVIHESLNLGGWSVTAVPSGYNVGYAADKRGAELTASFLYRKMRGWAFATVEELEKADSLGLVQKFVRDARVQVGRAQALIKGELPE